MDILENYPNNIKLTTNLKEVQQTQLKASPQMKFKLNSLIFPQEKGIFLRSQKVQL